MTALAFSTSTVQGQSKTKARVDVNSADVKTLETLPGIGPTIADRIVAGRPYKNAADLSKVKGLSKSKVDAIQDQITYGHGTTTTKKSTTKSSKQTTTPETTTTETTPSTKTKSSTTTHSSGSTTPSRLVHPVANWRRAKLSTSTQPAPKSWTRFRESGPPSPKPLLIIEMSMGVSAQSKTFKT